VRETLRSQRARSAQGTFPVQSPEGKRLAPTLTSGLAGVQTTPESLPVLEAFQKFLDAERKRARGRLVTLTLFFIALIISIVAVSMFVMLTYLDQTERDFVDFRSDLAGLRSTTLEGMATADLTIAGIQDEATELRRQITEKKDLLASADSRISSQFKNQDSRIQQLTEAVEIVRNENELLKGNLGRLESDLPPITRNADTVMRRIADWGLDGSNTPSDSIHETLVVSIAPKGTNAAVRCRLPIPE